MPIYVVSMRAIRIKASSESEAFQRLKEVFDKAYFTVEEVSQSVLNCEIAWENLTGPLQE